MKISASTAAAWWRGDKDKALAAIIGQEVEYPLIMEKAFAYGRAAHFCWELETKITHKLPVIFKLPQFEILGTEVKLYKQLNDDDWLSGIIDAIAKGKVNGKEIILLVDYKTGGKADRWQSCVYHYLVNNNKWWLENIGDQPDQFWYLSMDKRTGETRTEITKLTVPEKKEDYDTPDATTLTTGENFILTVLSEMKNELQIA